MCGIVGHVSRTSIPNGNLLSAMRDTMIHRGPDDAGLWLSADQKICLAHRRLSIIDLSPRGHQPMVDSSGQLSITFNGEIYNYQELRGELEGRGHTFRTATDTEVILEAYLEWDLDCLAHLTGMFAFGLYDGKKRRLFLARDRAGEKPLFYYHVPGKLLFASELKALMVDPAFPRVLDLCALDYYLAYGYVPADMCILDGVSKLPQGHAATYHVDGERLTVWRYWKLPEPLHEASPSLQELAEELESLLLASVRRQMVADVPIGIMLSGGVDSSLVTAMAARVSADPVRTFTVCFPSDEKYDESRYARMVAKYFGTVHTELVAETASMDLLPELARQYDEPIADSSMVPTYLLSRLIRQHAKVVLGGDGGDELFGGYVHYRWLLKMERLRRFVPVNLRRIVSNVIARTAPIGLRGRNYVIGFSAELPWSISHVDMYFDNWARCRLLAPVLQRNLKQFSPERYKSDLCSDSYAPVWQATAVDFKSYLVEDILTKVDRASMLTSLEVRAPWLDAAIIEFAFSKVPDAFKASQRELKILPRYLAKRLLPSELNTDRKQGFSIPLRRWLQGEWGHYFEGILGEVDNRLFSQRFVLRLLSEQRSGYDNSKRLFALVMFELWRRTYKVTIPEV